MSSVGLAESAVSNAAHGSDSQIGGYAGIWRRAMAYVIDIVLTQILAIMVVVPLSFSLGVATANSVSPEQAELLGGGLGMIVGVLIQWIYFTVMESSGLQATVGKRALGMKVTDADGRRIGIGKANGRYWGKIISALILFVGFLMIAFTKRKQGLHDVMAGTLVLKR
ncbi:MAG: RDD family protein [Abyssibacter sp.]|nr:RDD family protein [Abyssibacter sp.]MCK5860696.1 RDD family protein [Abyssibacter sp.]